MKKCFQVTEKWRFMKGQGKGFLIDDRTIEKADEFFVFCRIESSSDFVFLTSNYIIVYRKIFSTKQVVCFKNCNEKYVL